MNDFFSNFMFKIRKSTFLDEFLTAGQISLKELRTNITRGENIPVDNMNCVLKRVWFIVQNSTRQPTSDAHRAILRHVNSI